MSLGPRAIAAAVLLGAAVVLGAVLVTRSPAASPTASTTPLPVESGASGAGSTSTGSDVPPADPVAWRAVAWSHVQGAFHPGDPVPVRMDGLVDAGDLLVGWGRALTEGRNQFNEFGAVFVSRDGRSWRSILIDHGVGPADTSELAGIAVGPRGFLAFGGVCCEAETRAVWHSADGADWRRLELAGDLAPRASHFNAIVGVADGWVAVGFEGVMEPEARIWTSRDGATWTAVDHVDAGLGPGTISDVAAGTNGLVAVGTIDDAAGTHDGGIWLSDDGTSWRRVGADDPELSDAEETELRMIVPFAGGLFVTGNYGPRTDRIACEKLIGSLASADPLPPSPTATSCGWGREHHWVSADGTTWERVNPMVPLPDPAPIEFRNVVAGGPGLVVFGEENLPPSPDPNVWTSPDGRRWQRAEPMGGLPVEEFPLAIAVGERQLVLVAEHWDGGSERGTVEIWIGEIR